MTPSGYFGGLVLVFYGVPGIDRLLAGQLWPLCTVTLAQIYLVDLLATCKNDLQGAQKCVKNGQ